MEVHQPEGREENPNGNPRQIQEPVLHHEEADEVQRSDDKNRGRMDKHPQESQVMVLTCKRVMPSGDLLQLVPVCIFTFFFNYMSNSFPI